MSTQKASLLEHSHEHFLNRQDLAQRWACSLATIKRLEKRGTIRPMRMGPRIVRFRESDIVAVEQTAASGKGSQP